MKYSITSRRHDLSDVIFLVNEGKIWNTEHLEISSKNVKLLKLSFSSSENNDRFSRKSINIYSLAILRMNELSFEKY